LEKSLSSYDSKAGQGYYPGIDGEYEYVSSNLLDVLEEGHVVAGTPIPQKDHFKITVDDVTAAVVVAVVGITVAIDLMGHAVARSNTD